MKMPHRIMIAIGILLLGGCGMSPEEIEKVSKADEAECKRQAETSVLRDVGYNEQEAKQHRKAVEPRTALCMKQKGYRVDCSVGICVYFHPDE